MIRRLSDFWLNVVVFVTMISIVAAAAVMYGLYHNDLIGFGFYLALQGVLVGSLFSLEHYAVREIAIRQVVDHIKEQAFGYGDPSTKLVYISRDTRVRVVAESGNEIARVVGEGPFTDLGEGLFFTDDDKVRSVSRLVISENITEFRIEEICKYFPDFVKAIYCGEEYRLPSPDWSQPNP